MFPAVTQTFLFKPPPNRGHERGVRGGILIPPRLLKGFLNSERGV
jgi:hypothetical protein